MNKNQKGFAPLFLVIGGVVLLGVILFLLLSNRVSNVGDDSLMLPSSGKMQNQPEGVMFEELDEPEGTPEEINNEVVDELDSMINEVESTAKDEDLSDLSL